MKDAVRFSFANRIIYILYVLQKHLTGSEPFKHQRLQFSDGRVFTAVTFQSAAVLYSLKSSP
jgi:hypothetical protein